MKISQKDLEWAVDNDLITSEQATDLWQALEKRVAERPRFDLAHVAFYAGALVVIAAMLLFLTQAWDRLGGMAIFLISAGYGAAFGAAGIHLWVRRKLKVPGGLLVTIAVCMTPVAIYGVLRATGFWPQGFPTYLYRYHLTRGGSLLIMEAGTVLVGLVALRYIRFPFLTAPISFALWRMSMDVVPLIVGEYYLNEHQVTASIWFGLALLLVAYLIDNRMEEDYSFWGYLFGLMAFWGGLSVRGFDAGSELGSFLFFLLNLFLIVVSVFLERRAFTVFGAIGVIYYLGHLAYEVFEGSLMFPIVLSLIGVLIILGGIQYHKHAAAISNWLAGKLPAGWRWLRPKERKPSA